MNDDAQRIPLLSLTRASSLQSKFFLHIKTAYTSSASNKTDKAGSRSCLSGKDHKLEFMNHKHPLKRGGKPENIASIAVFLLSDKAGWISGKVMQVDDGISSIRK
ncbi:MAG: SDR family oxidoreductase [Bacteroidales bacterium]